MPSTSTAGVLPGERGVSGSSRLQGPHQLAHRLTTAGPFSVPRSSDLPPSSAARVTSGSWSSGLLDARRRGAAGEQEQRQHGDEQSVSRAALGLDQLRRLVRVGRALAVRRAPAARPGRRRRPACLAWQVRRPWKIRTWLSIVQSRFGNSAPMACSTLTGSVSSVQPNRRTSRPKWVSTVMPGTPNALPSTTLAVLRPTPGQRDEVGEPRRHLAVEALDEGGAELDQRRRSWPGRSRRADRSARVSRGRPPPSPPASG